LLIAGFPAGGDEIVHSFEHMSIIMNDDSLAFRVFSDMALAISHHLKDSARLIAFLMRDAVIHNKKKKIPHVFFSHQTDV
jgi:hypothetical protein